MDGGVKDITSIMDGLSARVKSITMLIFRMMSKVKSFTDCWKTILSPCFMNETALDYLDNGSQ